MFYKHFKFKSTNQFNPRKLAFLVDVSNKNNSTSIINRLMNGDSQMSEVKDYTTPTSDEGNTHYNGVPSEYGRRVAEQNRLQPNYCGPGKTDGVMRGEKSNEQAGP